MLMGSLLQDDPRHGVRLLPGQAQVKSRAIEASASQIVLAEAELNPIKHNTDCVK
ncbi:hypothetical protein OAJ84_05020 [Candidatus Puniceispirillum sp.]|nr:hypothetical protein [Candidatus Puniceispirillum sp.]